MTERGGSKNTSRESKLNMREDLGPRSFYHPWIVFLGDSCLGLIVAVPWEQPHSFSSSQPSLHCLAPHLSVLSLIHRNPLILWWGQMSPRRRGDLPWQGDSWARTGDEVSWTLLEEWGFVLFGFESDRSILHFEQAISRNISQYQNLMLLLFNKRTHRTNHSLSQGRWAHLQLKREKNPFSTIIYSIQIILPCIL